MAVLVTGGAGYIGSHVVRKLIEKNHKVIVFDNLSRGHIESLPREAAFEKVDLLNFDELKSSIQKYDFTSVIHFAAFAYVGESMENPMLYYENNVKGSLNLISAVKEKGVKNFVFSSTCSVYGNPAQIPMSEEIPINPINPYAKTKLIIENILSDFDYAYGMKYAALRYFNAAGDDDSGEIGESHQPEPHLIPLVMQTALGSRDKIYVYGNDYPTKDGTCIRDYIHVNDLADAHIKALEYLEEGGKSSVINLGTGTGYSVMEIIEKSREITGMDINAEIISRRPGDPAVLVADNKKAKEILGWHPEYDLTKILKTAWRWHKRPKY